MFQKWIEIYHAERFDRKLEVFESGFFVWAAFGQEFYFAEFFIAPEFRKSKNAFLKMMDRARELALENNCTQFSGHVELGTKNASEVLVLRLKYGFKIVTADSFRLGLKMEII